MAGAAALGAKPVEHVARVKAIAMEANLILLVLLFSLGARSKERVFSMVAQRWCYEYYSDFVC